jgi:hypothetical protein
MQLNRSDFAKGSLTFREAGDVVDTVYHEARHCEQWFRMAQMRAGQGLSAKAIADEMSIPLAIALRAVAHPIARGTVAAAIAEGWFDSFYGSGKAHNSEVIARASAAADAVHKAQAAFDKNPTPANLAALDRANARLDKDYADYKELPTENDAIITGRRASPGISRGTEEPDPDAKKQVPISGPDPEIQPQPTDLLASLPEFPDANTLFAEDDVVAPKVGTPTTTAADTGDPGASPEDRKEPVETA